MFSALLGELKENCKKALCEYKFLRIRSYPDFVFEQQSEVLQNEVPVFCFHSVPPAELEEQLDYLVKNEYQTLRADEFYEYLKDGKKKYSKTIMLTFDDGWRNLWSVVYPLLKKYGLVGVSFIVPTWIKDTENYYPNLEDYWSGRATLKQIIGLGYESGPYVTWREIENMHKSGVIDFQSHSLTHSTVFTSDRILNFVNPRPTLISHKIPIVKQNEQEKLKYNDYFGMPLYTMAPRLTGARRFLDDENLRKTCISYVKENGGEYFFRKRTWRKELVKVVEQYKLKNKLRCRYESDDEKEEAIDHELEESKVIIENRLGKSVRHFCYPFFSGSKLAVVRSKRCGYVTNFWGWQAPLDAKTDQYGHNHSYNNADISDFRTGDILKGRRTNRSGDDPYRIVRLPGGYIFSLPGEGRQSISQINIRRCFRNLSRLNR